MKISIRLTLLLVLSLLVVLTVLVVGFISYRNAWFTADNLSQQLLEQAMGRIESQIENVLAEARQLNGLTAQRLTSGKMRAEDFDAFVRYGIDAIELGGDLSSFFIGLEATGESVGVSKLSVKPSIWRSKKRSAHGNLRGSPILGVRLSGASICYRI